MGPADDWIFSSSFAVVIRANHNKRGFFLARSLHQQPRFSRATFDGFDDLIRRTKPKSSESEMTSSAERAAHLEAH